MPTPPSTMDCKTSTPWQPLELQQQRNEQQAQVGLGLSASGPWPAAPPTPQLSQASPEPSPPASPIEEANGLPTPRHTPQQPVHIGQAVTIRVLGPATGNAVRSVLTPVARPTGLKTSGGQEVRMQQWLAEIPPPQSPQQRYLQGLNPSADHPLHPQPLQVPPDRQSRYLDDEMLSLEYEKLVLDGLNKENDINNEKHEALSSGFVLEDGLGNKMILGSTKKRHNPEDICEEVTARKRTRMLDPVRRFSQRLSTSLALSHVPENDVARIEQTDGLSAEDAARQNEEVYRFGALDKQTKRSSNSAHLLLPKRRNGSFRSQSSGSMRRIVHGKLPSMLASPSLPQGSFCYWSGGRPDMIVNVAFIGDAHVGKTALIRRLVHGTFPRNYTPSGIQEQTIRLMVNDVRVEFNLTEGGSGRPANEPSVLALGWFSVVVLCYDVGRHDTLLNLQRYRNDVCIYEESPVVILAGLKKDSRRGVPPLKLSFLDEAAQVPQDVGQTAAEAMGCDKYFECSSLSSCDGVDELFEQIVQSGVEFQKARDRKMARFRFENSVDKGMAKITSGVRNLFAFRGKSMSA